MRFGIATTEIVPPFPTAMHGYGARLDPFDGVNDPLVCTAVVLEEDGRRAVIVTADLCTFPNNDDTPKLLDAVAKAVGCERDNVMLCASHTHGGPKTPSSSITHENMRFLDATNRYSAWLSEQVVAAATEAAGSMTEGKLWFGEGTTDVPMNRRPDRDGDVPNAPNPDGPTDSRLQYLVITDAAGKTRAVGLRVSCHPVATGAQHLLTADYVGAWRAEFTKVFGADITPFFLQGAGADARPRHVADGDQWRMMAHAELAEIGRDLLADLLQSMAGKSLTPVDGLVLEGTTVEVQVPCERRYTTADDLRPLLDHANPYYKRYAEEGLSLAEAGVTYPDHASYKVQTLWLNDDLCLIGLNAEPLCGLGAVVEAAVAPKQTMLIAYANGCVSYLPDSAELARGGYEAESFIYDLWTGPWKPGLENVLAAGVVKRGG